MKRNATFRTYSLFASLLTLSAGPAFAGPGKEKPRLIEIEAKVVQLSVAAAKALGLQSVDGEQAPAQIAVSPVVPVSDFTKYPGADLMSAPRVTTRIGERVIIEINREVRYPAAFEADEQGKLVPTEFETSNIGFTLEANATVLEGEKIDAEIQATISFFDGWSGYKDGKTALVRNGAIPDGFVLPVIGRTRVKSEVTLRSEETLVLGGYPCLFSGDLPDFGSDEAVRNFIKEPERMKRGEPMVQFLFITLRTLDENGNPALRNGGATKPGKDPITSPLDTPVEAMPAPKESSIPYATSSGRAGFVKSPFAPNSGYVDVRGFPRNVEVKCPYTGKVFLVP